MNCDGDRPPPFDPMRHGLLASLVRNGQIRVNEWMHAVEDGSIVGTCRMCGGYLVPDTPPSYRGDPALPWYVARCLDCGHEVAAPGGRTLRRSARASERGAG